MKVTPFSTWHGAFICHLMTSFPRHKNCHWRLQETQSSTSDPHLPPSGGQSPFPRTTASVLVLGDGRAPGLQALSWEALYLDCRWGEAPPTQHTCGLWGEKAALREGQLLPDPTLK